MSMADDLLPRSKSKSTNSTLQTQSLNQNLSFPEFSHLITRIAVGQICQSFGFRGAQSSAIEALTRIAALYIQSIGEAAAECAALCGGRTQCNVFDVVAGLEQLRLPSGFSGAGDVDQPLLSSGILKELIRFVNAVDEVPFARRIPQPEPRFGSVVFPAMSRWSERSSSEVPRWLPEFPEDVEELKPKRASKLEPFWEEKTYDQKPETAPMVVERVKKEKKGDGGFLLKVRRERVRFRLNVRDGKMGVNDLELRNGVCRGGKRICLAKRVSTFLNDDDDDDDDNGKEEGVQIENGKLR